MSRTPILETILDTSARVGSLLVPAGSLESCLGKFAYPLTVWTHDDVLKISLLGSSIGIVHSGRPLVVCSKHQLRGCELSDVGLLLSGGEKLITSSGSRTFHEGEHLQESDAYDVAAFNLTEPASEYPELSKDFFKFQQPPPDTVSKNIVAFIVAGYPSKDQKYDLEEKNHLGTVRRVLTAEPDSQPSDPALLKLKFLQTLDFDPDGLSGGPAFVVLLVGEEFQVYLGGMVLRSGKSHCYILKSGFLWSFLDSYS